MTIVIEDDRLREECGVFGIFGHDDAAALTALGLHALQHRGQEAAGIVTYDGERFHGERGLGLVSDEAAADAVAFRTEVGAVLAELGPRLHGLRSDPAVQELLADPAVVAMIQEGDTLGLLAHPGFRTLVDRISSAPSQP